MKRRTMIATIGAVLVPVLTHAAPAAADGPSGGTRYGVITSTQGPEEADTFGNYTRLYEQNRKRYGGRIGIRVFSPGRLPLPGDGSDAGKILAWAAANHPDEPITVSHKVRDDARLTALLDWVHAHRVRMSVIYFHEVQDDWFRDRIPGARPDVYKSTYRAYGRIISTHPARPLVTLEKNLMWYWQHVRAKSLGGNWTEYVERDDPADLVSWDAYSFPGMREEVGRYATPDEFFRYAREVWKAYGLPWAVGEIGTAVQNGSGDTLSWDRDGRKFTRWVRDITAAADNPASIGSDYVGVPPARFMKWWAARDEDGIDLSLEQVPAAAAAYRDRMRTARL
jgi:hypothetical protein